jgi:hypothetical protein
MGCGSSKASGYAVEPRPAAGAAPATVTAAARGGTWKFYPLTEAEVKASGLVEKAGYLGLHGTFYARRPEEQAERLLAVGALARDAEAPTQQSEVNAALREAKRHFADLDPRRPDAAYPNITDDQLRLTAPELEPLCAWLFDKCTRRFANPAERAVSLAKQLRSFNANTPTSSDWNFAEFEAYWRWTIEEAEDFQLGLNETYARRYNRRTAAVQFAEYDWDNSQFLEGDEAVAYAEKIFGQLCADRPEAEESAALLLDRGSTLVPSLSAAQHGRAEAAAMLKRLTLEKSGEGTNGAGISFACFDDYFTTKVQDVARYRAGIKARERWRVDQSAARIQSVARGRKGRGRVAAKTRARQIEQRLGLSWPGWPDTTPEEHASIATIQALCRAKVARRFVEQLRIERARTAEENLRREQAVTLIAAVHRGRQGRKIAAEARAAKAAAAVEAAARARAKALREAARTAARMQMEAALKRAADERRRAAELAAKLAAEQSAAETIMLRVWEQEERLWLPKSELPRAPSVAVALMKEADKNAVLTAIATAPPHDLSREVSLTGAALQCVMCAPTDVERAAHLRELEKVWKVIHSAPSPEGHTLLWSLTDSGRSAAAVLPRVQEWQAKAAKAEEERQRKISEAIELYCPEQAPVRLPTCLCAGPGCMCAASSAA